MIFDGIWAKMKMKRQGWRNALFIFFRSIQFEMSCHLQLYCLRVIYSEGERKYKDITLDLVRNELLNLAEYNVHMVKRLRQSLLYPSSKPLLWMNRVLLQNLDLQKVS